MLCVQKAPISIPNISNQEHQIVGIAEDICLKWGPGELLPVRVEKLPLLDQWSDWVQNSFLCKNCCRETWRPDFKFIPRTDHSAWKNNCPLKLMSLLINHVGLRVAFTAMWLYSSLGKCMIWLLTVPHDDFTWKDFNSDFLLFFSLSVFEQTTSCVSTS